MKFLLAVSGQVIKTFLLIGALIAVFLGGINLLLQIFSRQPDMTIIVISGTLCFIGITIPVLIIRSNKKAFIAALEKANQKYGSNFSLAETPNFGTEIARIFFDSAKRKALVVVSKLETRIYNYEDIKSWQLRWVEGTRNGNLSYSNVRIEFPVKDFHNPIFSIQLGSLREGEVWQERISMLLNGR